MLAVKKEELAQTQHKMSAKCYNLKLKFTKQIYLPLKAQLFLMSQKFIPNLVLRGGLPSSRRRAVRLASAQWRCLWNWRAIAAERAVDLLLLRPCSCNAA
jgi:hypothetical protein